MSKLIDEINKFKDFILPQIPEENLEKMLAETKRLEDLKISDNALKINDKAKEFSLPNAIGEYISLNKVLEENDFAVISFYRGLWCPYCNLEVKALQNINNELISLGAKLIAISPETPDLSLSMKEKYELEFEVLSDADYKVEKDYGLVFSLLEELRPIYEAWGFDIPGSNILGSYDLPMPATYVVNKNKEIIFSFIEEDYTKRCEPQDILNVIKINIK